MNKNALINVSSFLITLEKIETDWTASPARRNKNPNKANRHLTCDVDIFTLLYKEFRAPTVVNSLLVNYLNCAVIKVLDRDGTSSDCEVEDNWGYLCHIMASKYADPIEDSSGMEISDLLDEIANDFYQRENMRTFQYRLDSYLLTEEYNGYQYYTIHNIDTPMPSFQISDARILYYTNKFSNKAQEVSEDDRIWDMYNGRGNL